VRHGNGLCAVALAMSAFALPEEAAAHPLQFGVLHISEHTDGTVEVAYRYSGSEARPGGVVPVLPKQCVPVGSVSHVPVAYGEGQHMRARCGPDGLAGTRIGLRGLEDAGDVQVLVRVERADGTVLSATLVGDAAELHVPAGSARAHFTPYLALGVRHILEGVDHLLFVLGIMLLVGLRWALVATITSFTIGHSVTLALAALGLVSVPAAPVEAAIALSILLVAWELARAHVASADGQPSLTRRHPGLVAGLFGLLHGLGFAGALTEVGLPQGHLVAALLGFNLGVELGQLLFVAAVLAALVAARRLPLGSLRWPRTAAIYGIGSLAAYFLIDRLTAF
jgi:hypothetical protein